MNILRNSRLELILDNRGAVQSLKLSEDSADMNWVVDPAYLAEAGYKDVDKLFGEWTAVVNDCTVDSAELDPQISVRDGKQAVISYDDQTNGLTVRLQYELEEDQLYWKIACANRSGKKMTIKGLHVWFSLAYIMFRDDDVIRNMEKSCAVFPHMGGDYTKFAAMRRSNKAPHLGIYGIKGSTAAFGSLCRYENRFLEQVSPSLDGLLFHRLSLIEDGSSMPDSAAVDWIYRDGYQSVELDAAQELEWEYVFAPFQDQDDFYHRAGGLGHPRWSYTPVLTKGGSFEAELEVPMGDRIQNVMLLTSIDGQCVLEEQITQHLIQDEGNPQKYHLILKRDQPGEHKLELHLESGRRDVLVWNVLEPIADMLEQRAEWLCRHNYDPDGNAGRPHAFLPLSNQGESLGKLTFLLMKNRLTEAVEHQVQKAEASAVLDMKRHWFEQGNFSKPRVLYGTFYRIFDLDYIAHVFYLLSCMPASMLKMNSPETYLQWAAEVLAVRLNPDCHQGQREKDETGLNGVFILYVQDLLKDLKESSLQELYRKLLHLWGKFGERMEQGSQRYGGAITEHFYDNAGFGPTCETLLLLGKEEEAREYGELILANIGFSNDYRVQNPDRWWEALSYMIHSLWGGMVASSARTAYEHFGDPRYLEAAYRSTMAIFNCYDWNVVSTPRRLQPGEAASTFSVAAPNLNMPSLSRNRFGQSVFRDASDPLFAALFANVNGDDWDMGEELVAYLLGFGTTAYVYRDAKGSPKCVNGCLGKDGDGWIITSYAAYPQRFVMLEEKLELRAIPGEPLRQARWADGKLTRVMS